MQKCHWRLSSSVSFDLTSECLQLFPSFSLFSFLTLMSYLFRYCLWSCLSSVLFCWFELLLVSKTLTVVVLQLNWSSCHRSMARIWCKLALTVSEWAAHRCCHDIGLCGTPSVNSRGGTRWCKLVVAVVAHQREVTTRSRCWCWGGWWDSGAPGVSHQPLPLCCCRRRRFPHNPPFLARLALHVALLFSLRLVLVSC